MKTERMKVKTRDNETGWEFDAAKPESIEEAVALYGPELAFEVFNAGLDVKIQGIARNMFKAEKTVAEVEAAVRDYKPGSALRRSTKEEVMDVFSSPEFVALCNENPDAKTELKTMFGQGKLRELVARFKELTNQE